MQFGLKFYITIYLIGFSFSCFSQFQQFDFKKIEQGTVLSNNFINCLVQDHKGYIWVGTNEGLNKYNGYESKIYLKEQGNTNSLPDNKINALLEDSEHQLWIGTEFDGLCYYDSINDSFVSYRPKTFDVQSLSSKFVTSLAEDANYIWVGTYYGLNKIDKKTHQIEQIISRQTYQITDETLVNLKQFNANVEFTAVVKKNLKNKYVGETDLVNAFEIQIKRKLKEIEKKFLFNYSKRFLSIENLDRNEIKSLTIDKKGCLWVGFEKAGIGYYNPQKNTWEYFYNPLNSSQPIKANQTRPIALVGDTLWVCTNNNGVYQFDTKSKKFNSWGNDRTINAYACTVDKRRETLIGLGNNFIIVYPNKQVSIYKASTYNPNEKSTFYITAIIQDNAGSYWIGTQGAGLIFASTRKQFTAFTTQANSLMTLSKQAVSSLSITNDNSLWVGYYENDMDCFNLNTGLKKNFKHDKSPTSIGLGSVLKIYKDYDDNLWVGSYNAELKRYDKNTKSFVNYHNSADSTFDIRGIVKDNKGYIWAASHGKGVLQFDVLGNLKNSYKSTLDWKNNLTIDWTSDICIDKDNFLWVATVCGLSRSKVDKIAFESYRNIVNDNTSISHNQVRTVFTDSKNRVWIGTLNGLNLYNRKKNNFIRYGYSEGLANMCINAITEDANGNIWFSTNKGISKARLTDSINYQITVQNFNESDGILAGEYFQNSVAKSKDGKLYFGSQNGIISFNPDSIIESKQIPPVLITDIKIFTKSILSDSVDFYLLKKEWLEKQEITLKYDQNMLWIDYVALNYIQSERNQYCYKLEGFDKEWRYVQNNRRATYTNLAPGKYKFRLKACNNDGVWNEVGTDLRIVVLPPFWRSAIGRGILILLVSFLLFGTYLILRSREKFKHRIKLEQLETQNQLELNYAKNEFFTNITHEFRTPITLIIGPLQKIKNTPNHQTDVEKFKQQIDIIHRNANRLLGLINQILDLKKLESGKLKLHLIQNDIVAFTKQLASSFSGLAVDKHIHFEVISMIESLKILFDSEKYEKAINNLLSNAFKFTPEHGKISLILSIETHNSNIGNVNSNSCLVVEISDSGIGIPKDSISKIFELYFQVQNNNVSGNPGTGIGLYMVKQMIELHGGSIEVESEENKGSKFKIQIPIPKLQPEFASYETKNIELYGIVQSEEIKNEPIEMTDKSLKVLIVEDNEDMRLFIRSELEDYYQVLEAVNGKEGLQMAEELNPNIIISDVMMPVMNGLEMCQKLKQNINTSHLAVILLTAKSSEDAQLEGFQAGADDYMTKPFNTQILKIKLEKLLKIKTNHQIEFTTTPEKVTLEIQESNPVESKFLKNLVDIVTRNIENSDLDVSFLASELNLSRTVLYEKIQSATGMPVADYIRTFKLNFACQLLSEKEMNISEVSYRVGYKSLAHFTRSFKKQFEMTPSEYIQKTNSNK